MIDHVYISVSDVPRSFAFYAAALRPLGWRELGRYDSDAGPAGVPDLHGLGDAAYSSGQAPGSSIWLRQRQPGETGLYIGFVAVDRAAVDAANVADFDGNRLEFVRKG
jgi:catechol 2,3-dioxygenase-like lactoylglutathione lyase family enzyme